jgi:PPK2 family polyphosphate:nucleotide phosphotransferase
MIKIKDISALPPATIAKEWAEEATKNYVKRIGELQEAMYAEQKHSLLVVFQGMDGSGKDGAMNNVFSKCNLSGVTVTGYKKPTEEEFAHDFLWRIHKNAPKKGQIAIFVRSHYEDVLIQRVHGWIDEARVTKRIAAINAFEDLLQFDNQTVVLKFFLHISLEEQAKQLMERIETPEKRWKHNDGDWSERKLWDDYMSAYENVLNHAEIPWTITPVDKRWYRDYIVSKTVCEAMENLHTQFPVIAIDMEKVK